jgi:hypothetical protein
VCPPLLRFNWADDSLPISYEDAIPILNALKGHGTPAGEISEDWVGGLEFYGVEYFTGPSEVELHFVNEVNTRVMPIWSESSSSLILNRISPDK